MGCAVRGRRAVDGHQRITRLRGEAVEDAFPGTARGPPVEGGRTGAIRRRRITPGNSGTEDGVDDAAVIGPGGLPFRWQQGLQRFPMLVRKVVMDFRGKDGERIMPSGAPGGRDTHPLLMAR